jgi:RimJ/RimL family protein N-acetyltransferase
VRRALAQRLDRVPGIQVVGSASAVQEGIRQTHDLRPDVVLLEPKLAGGHGLDALRAIRDDNPSARVILLTSYIDDFELEVAMRLGAERYLLKDLDSQRLADVILGRNGSGARLWWECRQMTPTAHPKEPETVVLRNGETVTLRPIRPDDAPRLQAFHTRLSPESIYFRYHGTHPLLRPEEARWLSEVDYQTRMALVALREEGGEEQLIGVARYCVLGLGAPDVAEVAIIVEDRHQGKGLGTLLVDRLAAYARAHGIREFAAEVSVDNDRMLRFIRRIGLPMEKRLELGEWDIRIKLQDDPERVNELTPA